MGGGGSCPLFLFGRGFAGVWAWAVGRIGNPRRSGTPPVAVLLSSARSGIANPAQAASLPHNGGGAAFSDVSPRLRAGSVGSLRCVLNSVFCLLYSVSCFFQERVPLLPLSEGNVRASFR